MSTIKKWRVGVCGLGVVGAHVVKLLQQNAPKELELVAIGARRPNPLVDTSRFALQDIFTLADDPSIDILVELIGGTQVAYDLVARALQNGKHVVTANKALLAERGVALSALAQQQGKLLRYEAAVAGGIPLLRAIKEGLSANKIHSIVGIINGTSNFVLSKMTSEGCDFQSALKTAQELGFAEADPIFDIDGTDAAHKLTLLTQIGFNAQVEHATIPKSPISQISAQDISQAGELGYVIKPLAFAYALDTDICLGRLSYACKKQTPLVSGRRCDEWCFCAL